MSEKTRTSAARTLPAVWEMRRFDVVDALTAHILDEVARVKPDAAPVLPPGVKEHIVTMSVDAPPVDASKMVPPPDAERMSASEAVSRIAWFRANQETLTRERNRARFALDVLRVALAGHGHQWTPWERRLYETGIGNVVVADGPEQQAASRYERDQVEGLAGGEMSDLGR